MDQEPTGCFCGCFGGGNGRAPTPAFEIEVVDEPDEIDYPDAPKVNCCNPCVALLWLEPGLGAMFGG